MNAQHLALRTLFQRIVFATALPVAGCGATVVIGPDGGSPPEDRAPVDRVEPVDRRDCAPQVGPMTTCSRVVTFPCGDMPLNSTGELDCNAICPREGGGSSSSCYPYPSGSNTVQCTYCVVGRRVDGFAPALASKGDVVGCFYAGVAQLEAASVVAFERLARELEFHHAPAQLRDDALRAAKDERRHTRIAGRIAMKRGAMPDALPALSTPARSLRAMAIDNAVEGCVRETFGALVGTWQAAHAEHRDIAHAMGAIARDETGHAALSWSVARWLDGVLDDDDRAAVTKARAEAVEGLLAELAAPVDLALVRDAGMPGPEVATRLARAMFTELALS